LSVENWEEHVLDTAFTTRRFPVVLSHLEVLFVLNFVFSVL
jgi:hypothetical protein